MYETLVKYCLDAILFLLNLFYHLTGSYGVAILLLTLFFKAVTYPLTRKSMLAMKKMATLQPLMQELQKRFKDDQAKLQQEMAKLYREKGINPVAGCLPMFLQLPVFILLYTVLRDPTVNHFAFVNHNFLGMDLSTNPLTPVTADFLHNFSLTLPGTVVLPPITFFHPPEAPYLGVLYLPAAVLLLFMLATQFASTLLTATGDKNQKMQMMIFNVLFIWFGIGLPSGVLLYWTAQNVLGIAQQWLINREHDQLAGAKNGA